MKYVETIADSGHTDTITAIAESHDAVHIRAESPTEDNLQTTRILISDDQAQPLLDSLQRQLATLENNRVVVMPVETTLPRPAHKERAKEDAATASRQALHEEMEKSARLGMNYLLLVVLSTLVAAIGLIENNVAVVIGAMVIAPLLGPNIALNLGSALGDYVLMREAMVSLFVGLAVAVGLSTVIGLIWPDTVASPELLTRTTVGVESAALALASGAAAALSLTSGLSSTLVGVMVAVALLPPAATVGITLGQGQFAFSTGAFLLLAINIICVNLASNLVFLCKGIHPRTELEKQLARRTVLMSLACWLAALAGLLAFTIQR